MKSLFAFLFSLVFSVGSSQDYGAFTQATERLFEAGGIGDSARRAEEIHQAWSHLQHGGIPLVQNDSAAFLYRGEAKSVVWMGDFNGWGYDKTFNNKGRKIPGTNVWILKCSFPPDARLDYKIYLDGMSWILDPENPNHQWSGVGGGSPNSELRMPLWHADPILTERPGTARGKVKKDLLFASKVLGYQVMYTVYLPHGYEKLGQLPVLYVTDGYEYVLPELGNILTVLDNLIADKKIQPVIAILVDHREPVNRSNNRRMEELNMSEKYLKFFADEFLPAVEAKYPVHRDAAHRAVLGAAMGGLTSAYFAFARPDLFSMAGMQSPAFWTRPQIYSMCDSTNATKIKVSITSGLINDASESSRRMKDILQNNACVFSYRENNEGPSWGNWRNLIDDILIDFFGTE